MDKENNIKEKFKQALISTVKVISDDYKINIVKKNASSQNFNFFELDNLNNKQDFIRFRAEADSEALRKKFSNKDGFAWGVNTTVEALKPDIEWQLNNHEGVFTLTKWEAPQPTSQELREEYIRQQTIAECIDYFRNNKIEALKILFKKNYSV